MKSIDIDLHTFFYRYQNQRRICRQLYTIHCIDRCYYVIMIFVLMLLMLLHYDTHNSYGIHRDNSWHQQSIIIVGVVAAAGSSSTSTSANTKAVARTLVDDKVRITMKGTGRKISLLFRKRDDLPHQGRQLPQSHILQIQPHQYQYPSAMTTVATTTTAFQDTKNNPSTTTAEGTSKSLRQKWGILRMNQNNTSIQKLVTKTIKKKTKYHHQHDKSKTKNKSKLKVIRSVNKNTSTKNKYNIHPAISFLEPEPTIQHHQQQQQQPQQCAVSNNIPTTRVGTLAKYFSNVLIASSNDSDTTTTTIGGPSSTNTKAKAKTIIDMDQLLKACYQLEKAMIDVEQKLSARDLHNNIIKVESLYHTVQSHNNDNNDNDNIIKYNDMESLLKYEKGQNIHIYDTNNNYSNNVDSSVQPRLVALNEQSCAMGLLWIRRSIQFQYHLYDALLQNMDATTATIQSYSKTLQPYHSWTLQQLYTVAVKSATPSNQLWFSRLGGYDVIVPNTSSSDTLKQDHTTNTNAMEQQTRKDLHHLLKIWKPLIDQWEQIYIDLNLNDQRRV